MWLYPPLAKMLLAPTMTVLTREMMVKIAESGMSVTSRPTFDKLLAIS